MKYPILNLVHILASFGIIFAIAGTYGKVPAIIASPFVVGGLWWLIRFITTKHGIDVWN